MYQPHTAIAPLMYRILYFSGIGPCTRIGIQPINNPMTVQRGA